MADDPDLGSTTFPQRVVLLGVAKHETRGETPVHSAEVVGTCTDELDGESDVLGRLSEAEVMRALNRLEAEGFVREEPVAETSPVGKGRPTYELTVETGAVLDACEDDDRLATVAERIRNGARS